MTDIDDRIRDVMDDDDRAFLSELEADRGLWRQIGDSLTGPMGGWAKLIFVIAFFIGMGLIYAGYRFFTAEAVDDRILWGLVTVAALLMQGFTKDWFFSRMNMLNILREVKRLQWQVAQLEKERS
jgi:hypothetical protein